jgi:hypothetical protein
MQHVHGRHLPIAGQFDKVLQGVDLLVNIAGLVFGSVVPGCEMAAFGNVAPPDLLRGRQKNTSQVEIRSLRGDAVQMGTEFHFHNQVHAVTGLPAAQGLLETRLNNFLSGPAARYNPCFAVALFQFNSLFFNRLKTKQQTIPEL